MRAKTFFTLFIVVAVLGSTTPVLPAFAAEQLSIERAFTSPIDAFSARMLGTSFSYSTKIGNRWSAWQVYEDDGDSGVGGESELIMLPENVTALRVKNIQSVEDIHPITVSHEPVKTRVAAVTSVAMPSVIDRNDWGADESYLFEAKAAESAPAVVGDAAKGDNGGDTGQVSQRVKDCQSAQQNYPAEFSVGSTVKKDAQGRSYLWPLQYSKDVKLLVVHHSALVVQNDPRPAVERVRALYKYHALTKGWGDVGYNFMIDEDGNVYEGRLGGKYTVGGHAYCNNVGTIGIVLMGNFEIEQPSDTQAKSLQRLLKSLASDYHLDVSKSVQFHGKKFDSPIVRHRDLLSTLCPGYYLADAFGQVVKNVQTGNLNAAVIFQKKASSSSSSSAPASVLNSDDALKPAAGISFTGRNAVTINPGGKQRLSFMYTADASGAYESKKVADIKLSDPRIKLWLDDGRVQIPVTKGILLPSDLPAFESASLQLIVQAPMAEGQFSMDIGGIHFTISVAGRRARSGEFINPFSGNSAMIVVPKAEAKSTSIISRIRPQSRVSSQSSTSSFSSSFSSTRVPTIIPQAIAATPFSPDSSKPIRIRLSADASPSITFSDRGFRNGTGVLGGTTFDLFPRGSECEVRSRGERVTSDAIIRFSSSVSGMLSVSGIKGKMRSYHGVIECRVVNGVLTLINELPLENYMAGLAEEPDTEPYEKQRAFAIAARTYAAFYMDPANRKFPGMPYDGSDDPAIFQVYHGVGFTAANPNWLRAVMSTENDVLTMNGKIIKPPYFSSNDGRTRSPAEAGWKNFPFAEIFISKPDPWCSGMTLRGHGVGMSGCGALGQAKEGKSAEQILLYYYPGVRISKR